MLFWFAGFIALAVFHRDLVNDANYYIGGCDAIGNICGVIEAAVVFGALEWYVCFLKLFGVLVCNSERDWRNFGNGSVFYDQIMGKTLTRLMLLPRALFVVTTTLVALDFLKNRGKGTAPADPSV